jgi:hypothetical protein
LRFLKATLANFHKPSPTAHGNHHNHLFPSSTNSASQAHSKHNPQPNLPCHHHFTSPPKLPPARALSHIIITIHHHGSSSFKSGNPPWHPAIFAINQSKTQIRT